MLNNLPPVTMSQAQIAVHGLRNSLLLANMPTASTAQILGNNESVEPFTRSVMDMRQMFCVTSMHNKYFEMAPCTKLTNVIIPCILSNMYNRRVLAGEFAVVNTHLLKDLTQRGLWNATIRNRIIADQGSVQHVDIPEDLKVYCHYSTSTSYSNC